MSGDTSIHSSGSSRDQVYDKAIKTIVQDATPFLIPLINYLFGENFSNSAKIERISEQGVHKDEKGRHGFEMDIHVVVSEGGVKNEYVIEFQSTPSGSILVRIVKYILGAAISRIREVEVNGTTFLRVQVPEAAIVYLRPPRNLDPRAVVYFDCSVQDGLHEIKILRMDTISVDTILDNDLLCLVPFFLFRYAAELNAIENDPERLGALLLEYQEVAARLRERVQQGSISREDRVMLIRLTEEVTDQLAANYVNVREVVDSGMTDGVIMWRSKDIYRSGQEEGKREGKLEERMSTLKNLIGLGLGDEEILRFVPTATAADVGQARSELSM